MKIKTLLSLLLCLTVSYTASAVVSPKPAAPLTAEEFRAQVREHRQMERETMTGKERRQLRRERRKEMRETIREYRRGDADAETVLYAILALILPPLAVFLAEGQQATGNLYLNLLLVLGGIVLTIILGTFLWFLPAIIHALLVVFGSL